MLSYRHGFHAGNPADVFKHGVLVALVRAMQEKPRGIQFIDTHAGAAVYDLASPMALKTREFEAGIAPLWTTRSGSPDGPLAAYLEQVERLNPDGVLARYPGSPELLHRLLRRKDRLVLCELHPAEQHALRQHFAGRARVRIEASDGYRALLRYLPPTTGRGLVLIDPSYELKDEIDRMTEALIPALGRFGNGVYAIWYPLIEGRDIRIDDLPARLGLAAEAWLDLRVAFSPGQRLGRMFGCGMALINPPWRARERLIELTEKEFGGSIHAA